jgi:hypothetical protein
MTATTIHVFDASAIRITTGSGGAPRNGNVLNNAQHGDAFSWENPSNLTLTFPATTVAITYEDADGLLTDDPYAGATVTDQMLTQPVTLGGRSYSPSNSTIRWQNPAPVTVENEYEVTLYDPSGTAYRMVGVSITQGYTSTVVGVMFDGPAPPPGVPLTYVQGVSSYSGSGQSAAPGAVPCFLAGTLIDTPRGPRRIQTLHAGDPVTTLDNGPQPIRWIGQSLVPALGALAPIRIAPGRFGNRRALFVSPNHRILISTAAADLYFGHPEVLVAAKHLVDGDSVQRLPRRSARYLHLALEGHQILFSEGIASESLHAGPQALATLTPAARAELQAIFPDQARAPQRLARRSLTAAESRVLLSRAPARQVLAAA